MKGLAASLLIALVAVPAAAPDSRVVGTDRYVLTGAPANLKFAPKLGTPGSIQLVTVEEGHFAAGKRGAGRLLNGDETALGLRHPLS